MYKKQKNNILQDLQDFLLFQIVIINKLLTSS